MAFDMTQNNPFAGGPDFVRSLANAIQAVPLPTHEVSKMEQYLPRVWELYNTVRQLGHQGTSYFSNFDTSLNSVLRRKCWEDIESDLNALDEVAWNKLKTEVVPRFEKRDPNRGWQAAFDILNEAKAYKFLKELGCTELQFIPRSTESGQKTPDLQGKRNGKTVFCEVKTINASDSEINARNNGTGSYTRQYLPEGFFSKLEKTVGHANKQITDDASVSRIVYVILNFDDSLHEYASDYIDQIRTQVPSLCPSGIEVVFDVKPAYYSATSISQRSTVLHCSMDGCIPFS
jgi:hypothetical protein